MNDVLIPIHQCPFEKTNLVTKFSKNGSFDEYRCSKCGLKGRRFGVSQSLTTNLHCGKRLPGSVGQVIITVEKLARGFGLEKGKTYPVVPCPADMRARFPRSTWVHSPTRSEPVRLLSDEFEPAPDPVSQ